MPRPIDVWDTQDRIVRAQAWIRLRRNHLLREPRGEARSLIGREELNLDQLLVIWLELLGIDEFTRFGVRAVRVGGPDGSQRLLIYLVTQVTVRPLPMPPIENTRQ